MNEIMAPGWWRDGAGTFTDREREHTGASGQRDHIGASGRREQTGASERRDARPEVAVIVRSGLFDPEYYASLAPALEPDTDPVAHFLDAGCAEGRKPNRYFDPPWYARQYPDVVRRGINPLLDYIDGGEAAGRSPSAYFDVIWYGAHQECDAGATRLAHFLRHRRSGTVSPVPEFDAGFYVATYPDIAAAHADPFEHYLDWGYREGRNPSAAFDTRFYVKRYMDGDFGTNPLLHYRHFRHVLRLHTTPPQDERLGVEEVRRFTRPGPLFERFKPLPRSVERRAKLLAYYLPQFHPIPENDAWWGDGFTEWTSVARGQPRFAGHYQPRLPRDLGHYSLDDPATMRRQIDMARDAGLFGFVMYFYWFNTKRLLDKPLESFLADRSLDFPFCLMWANENWTRRWDGSDEDVLISQDYRAADDAALVDCFARHFRDSRYIRIGGRPVLMIYRPRLIPDTAATLARWRRMFRDRHGENPVLVMAQSFGEIDPRPLGLDGAVEFPPHKLVTGLPSMAASVVPLDPRATPQIYDYDEVAAASLAEPPADYPLIKTAVPGWDNDARRDGNGLVIHGSTPEKYREWLSALVERARVRPFLGEAFVCINAWNEWAEGAYLEPDVHFGGAFANATGRAVADLPPASQSGRVLLVGHDAFPAGAQHLLLNIGRTLSRQNGARPEFLLLAGGALLASYQAEAPTLVAADETAVRAALAAARSRDIACVIVNTAAAAWVAPLAAAAGMRITLLVHELDRVIAERGLVPAMTAGCAAASRIVFPESSVAARVAAVVAMPSERLVVLPQGCYRPAARNEVARHAIRTRLGLTAPDRLVLGAGTGDLRKGFDLFLQAWRATGQCRAGRTVFAWIGRIDPSLETWLAPEVSAAAASGTFVAAGHRDDAADWFSAADAFALTSREDPYPTVVMEAFSAGLPIVAFAGSGGAPALIERLDGGVIVPMADAAAMAVALDGVMESHTPDDAERLATSVAAECDFPRYVADLLALARPGLPTISVVVTNCDYAEHLPARLGSIFAQTLPVREVMLLDDASTDTSIAVAAATAADWQREIGVALRPLRSGSAFGQWGEAVARASGDFLWIAEADDMASPGFLAAAAEAIRATPDAVLVATDARAIDRNGAALWPDHQGYFRDAGAAALAHDLVLPAREFAANFLTARNLLLNVSGIVWRRDALLRALERIGGELASWRLAGDWRVAAEILLEETGSVAWIAAPLNVHRRHAGSVTGTTAARRHIDEVGRMQSLMRDRLALASHAVAGQRAALDALRKSLTPARRGAGARNAGSICR